MERVTISMSDAFAAELADFMAAQGYDNRSEAVRDLAREGLKRLRRPSSEPSGEAGDCVATLSYVFEHGKRDLARRLTEAHHDHHDLQVATLHVHLDHDTCLEVAVLRGPAPRVRDFSARVVAESGVRFGEVSLVPVTLRAATHAHGGDGTAQPHLHLQPKP